MDLNLPQEMDSRTLSEAGVTLKILSPRDGQPLMNQGKPVAITTFGPDSKAYRDAEREVNKRRVMAMARQEEFDEDRAAIEVLARVTRSWTGILNKEGAEVACSFEAACGLYTLFPIIRDQVAAHVGNRRNFIAASPGA